MVTREPGRVNLRGPGGALTERAFRLQIFAEVYNELRRVEWPTFQQVARLTVVVIALSAIIGVFLGLIDLFLTFVVNGLYLGV